MASPPTMTTTFDQLFADRLPYLEELIYKGYEENPDEYSVYANVKTSGRYKETDFMVAGLGLFPAKLEGADITSDTIEPSYYKDFVHVTYARATDVTMEALEDDQDAVLDDSAYELGYSARQTVEQLCANEFFNYAFTTTFAADGAAIYGAHTTAKGYVWNNSGAVDLDDAGLTQALVHFGTLYDEAGRRIRMLPELLIVPPQLEKDAYELVESMGKPGTADNDLNWFRTKGLRVHVNHYLSSTTAWFLWASSRRIKAKHFWRTRPRTITDVDFRSQNALTGMLFRCSQGVSDPRGLWGSTGS